MLLAELEVWHTRPAVPTRRLSLGHLVLPVDPAPGFGGLLLGAVVAGHIYGVDDELHPDIHRLIDQIERGDRVVQPRLRHRFQVDRHGLARQPAPADRRRATTSASISTARAPLAQVLGAVYAVERLEQASRRVVAPVLHKAAQWRGPIGPALIAHLAGAQTTTLAALADPTAWALDVLGFPVGTTAPTKREVTTQYRAAAARRASRPRRRRDQRRPGDPRPQRGPPDPDGQERMTRGAAVPGRRHRASHPASSRSSGRVAPMPCVRADFPYRKPGRRAPDRPPVLMAAVRSELDAVVGAHGGPVVLGGRSMGGRMCSMVAGGRRRAPPPAEVAGLVLICYPLHPPGKPDRLRVEHLPAITVPCLFVSGTKDPFGTPDELERWTATIPGDVHHVWIEGAGHDLKGADGDDRRRRRHVLHLRSVCVRPSDRGSSEADARSGFRIGRCGEGGVLGVELLELAVGGLGIRRHDDDHDDDDWPSASSAITRP